MLFYDQLTPAQKEAITNGCGGKGGFCRPPHWFGLEGDCDLHDFLYTVGCTEQHRLEADRILHDLIQHRASGAPLWKRWYYRTQAWVYYRAVRAFGGKFFRYGDHQMTYDEMVAYIAGVSK